MVEWREGLAEYDGHLAAAVLVIRGDKCNNLRTHSCCSWTTAKEESGDLDQLQAPADTRLDMKRMFHARNALKCWLTPLVEEHQLIG